jgi:hypothetical protein
MIAVGVSSRHVTVADKNRLTAKRKHSEKKHNSYAAKVDPQ